MTTSASPALGAAAGGDADGATEAVVGLGARPGETVQPAGRAVRLGLR